MGLFQRLKDAVVPPKEEDAEIVASFYMVEMEETATGAPALMVVIETAERTFFFLENQVVAIHLSDQNDTKSWDLKSAGIYEGSLPWD